MDEFGNCYDYFFIKLVLFKNSYCMDKRFKLLFIILCFAISAFAQQFSVSGRVTDADGQRQLVGHEPSFVHIPWLRQER